MFLMEIQDLDSIPGTVCQVLRLTKFRVLCLTTATADQAFVCTQEPLDLYPLYGKTDNHMEPFFPTLFSLPKKAYFHGFIWTISGST